ncbi:hypothetical protein [Halobaculum sp. D14]|uniref:hypothetical protein n=1 Tax=Halobaculum sp. D14 TaxID=3421642 RepID=UPI003EBE567A
MIEWFSEQFTNPVTSGLVLGLRFLSYFFYSALVAVSAGLRARLTAFSVVLSVLSVLLTMLVIHPDGFPDMFSYVDILIHLTFPVLAGYAVYSNPSNRRWVSFSLLLLSTFYFFSLLIVLYGEGP